MMDSLRDRISEMPEPIIDCILQRMPIKDAVKTSILSREWRFNWRSTLSHLVFDEEFFYTGPVRYRLSDTIKETLFLHYGPFITKFSLYIPFEPLSMKSGIDDCILFVSRKGVKDFTLDIETPIVDKYELPSVFFSSLDLTHLKLGGCIFSPPVAFSGFCNIISLNCYEVEFRSLTFESMMSSCPLLEDLTLELCTGFECLNFCYPNLKTLNIAINGNGGNPITFKDIKNLRELSVELDEDRRQNSVEGLDSKLMKLLESFPKIEKLCLGYDYFKFLAAGAFSNRQLPRLSSINNLKSLKIKGLNFAELNVVAYFLCLIGSFPNLHELEIWGFPIENAADDMEPLKEASKACTLDKLRTVKIELSWGLKPELEFIKWLVGSSPSLLTFTVELRYQKDASAILKVAKELLKLQRASPKSEIIFLHRDIESK